MMSSVILAPEKGTSSPWSPLISSNGRTAIAGGSGRAYAERGCPASARRSGLCIARPVHGADEANILARNGADEPLFLAVVADRVSGGVDRPSSVKSETIRPPDISELDVPGDHAIAVLQQVNQQIEYLRLHRRRSAAPAHLTTVGVQDATIETEFHVAFSRNNEVRLKGKAESWGRSPASCQIWEPHSHSRSGTIS